MNTIPFTLVPQPKDKQTGSTITTTHIICYKNETDTEPQTVLFTGVLSPELASHHTLRGTHSFQIQIVTQQVVSRKVDKSCIGKVTKGTVSEKYPK